MEESSARSPILRLYCVNNIPRLFWESSSPFFFFPRGSLLLSAIPFYFSYYGWPTDSTHPLESGVNSNFLALKETRPAQPLPLFELFSPIIKFFCGVGGAFDFLHEMVFQIFFAERSFREFLSFLIHY